ncbi:hypothetical protein GK047_20410 [Paenibacillus sp. SYP-B3998]|uniref:Uncharacterized protein n=1 Tax=Paenibacillus sp. SYP-B3998 TaxID=2678564 RepID=A0A6G4A1V8_9BACL|nr:hypothetical protein [Paenibacillus sp. SYP-B3998]NEW08365.1 hypothetical protein [Paenibacillus sp. SYP-B3998]
MNTTNIREENRQERFARKKKETRFYVFRVMTTPIYLIPSVIVYFSSFLLWIYDLRGSSYYHLLQPIVELNISILGLFIIVSSANIPFVTSFTRSLLKILLTGWVVILIQFSKLDQLDQSVWIVLSGFAFIYLEVLFDINDCLQKVKEFQFKKVRFFNGSFIKSHSIPITIVAVAVINLILSYFISDLLKSIA